MVSGAGLMVNVPLFNVTVWLYSLLPGSLRVAVMSYGPILDVWAGVGGGNCQDHDRDGQFGGCVGYLIVAELAIRIFQGSRDVVLTDITGRSSRSGVARGDVVTVLHASQSSGQSRISVTVAFALGVNYHGQRRLRNRQLPVV